MRSKGDSSNVKEEIINLIKVITKRLILFFVFIYIIYTFCFVYVLSFNYVYYFTQTEWIKSSVFIFIIMELIKLLISLLSTCLRLLSFKCKSEKLFKLCNLLANA